jgi:hypothetical protein
MTHVPTGAKRVTNPVEELTVQPEVDVWSTLKVTGLPDAPPVAVTVYVVPMSGLTGGAFVKLMVWVPGTVSTV